MHDKDRHGVEELLIGDVLTLYVPCAHTTWTFPCIDSDTSQTAKIQHHSVLWYFVL